MNKLSIIVPVYQVEKYIRTCMESVFRQGLNDDDFEIIIVNDGTKDRSMEVIADIIEKHQNTIVINQENQGISVTRNNGMAHAKGEYILMLDSDDLLIDNSLSVLLDIALKTKADLVVADFITMTSEEIDSFKGITQSEPVYQEKYGKELFMEDLNPNYCKIWRVLHRRAFLEENQLRFIPNIYYEDVPFTHECFLKARKCMKTSWLLNIYRKERPGSYTTNFSTENVENMSHAIGATWKLRTLEGLTREELRKLEDDVYATFTIFVYHTISGIRKYLERNKVMDSLKAQAPDLSFTHGPRQRITTFFIKNMPHLYINLFYLYAQIAYRH